METQTNTGSVLHDGLVALGFADNVALRPLNELEPLMERYIALLQEYNAKFDLINTDDHDEIAVRHILDSLAAVPNLSALIAASGAGTASANAATPAADFLMADIGSGAGLPGIPLAAAFPTVPFMLVERMTKRCAFLQTCACELGLENVTVEENQAERLEQNRFDLVVFRAFRPLEKKMLHVLRRILKDGGKLAAYKAKHDKISEEMEALGKNMPVYSVQPLTVPFLADHERNLVVIEK